ncbi:hypothetical protein [Escherichia coli]|jgi:hypothetical protein|uniref:hypothetical protein n=1 Tax=Escherichia coli TaxID=562 RepID=UPI00111A1C4C|nr:hypothetical protein [Escherichia coli]EFI9807079.1 hypothetical protein [Escherichia coli]EFJ2030880.1 hypothetical protein [Escherichia coli]EJN1873121.1 hypothetical protein [Escherichia coli]TNH65308.1 hypothetical protein FG869_06230 [Escherichia coli]TPD46392.1 hypothetical protein FIS44_00095 [Escherichia coli]
MKRLAKAVMMAALVGFAFNANANEAMSINCNEVANHVAEYHKIIKKDPAAIGVFNEAINKHFEGKPIYATWFNWGLVKEAAVGVVFEGNDEIKNRIANECNADKAAFAERMFNEGGAGVKNHAIIDLGGGRIEIVRIK